jgi:hypothetical protein
MFAESFREFVQIVWGVGTIASVFASWIFAVIYFAAIFARKTNWKWRGAYLFFALALTYLGCFILAVSRHLAKTFNI